MKSKKMNAIVTCGLGCALALSLSPAAAFAAPVTGTGVDEDKTTIEDLSSDGEAATDVKVFGTDSQISVTVPVGLTVAASGAPGAALAGVPTNYSIVNDSYFDVQVKKITATPQAGWDYSDAKVATTANVTNGNVGIMHLDLYPTVADASTKNTGGVAITTAGVDTTATANQSAKWKILAKKNETTPTTLPVGINGTTKLDQGLSEDSTSAASAVTLTYTIGRATA